jgi:chemotaxis response regulator CheB
VVLSGEPDDGSRRLEAIHNEDGVTMMPESATSYDGPVDFIGSVKNLAQDIVRRVGIHRVGSTASAVSMA